MSKMKDVNLKLRRYQGGRERGNGMNRVNE